MRPHYNHSSRENATPSSGTSPLATCKGVPPPGSKISAIQRSSGGLLLTSMIIASLKQNKLLKMILIFHVRFTCLTFKLTGTSTEWIQFALRLFSTAPIYGYLICMDRAVLYIFLTLLIRKIHRLFNLSKRSDTWSQEKDPDTTKYGQTVWAINCENFPL